MSKITMTEVYRVLWNSDRVRVARTEGKEAAMMRFDEFESIMGRDDFIVSPETAKKKWKLAIEDQVVSPFSMTYGQAAIMLENLAVKLHEPYRVCVSCVCVSEGLNTTSKGAAQ